MASESDMTLLVLAAGMGSRYGGLKQIDPVGPSRERLLDYSIYDAMRAGYNRVVFVIREDIAHDFYDVIISRIEHVKGLEIVTVNQDMTDLPEGFSVPEGRSKPWGTGHAIRAARDVIDGPFVAINADDFYGAGAFQTIGDWQRANAEKRLPDGRIQWAMVAYRLLNTLSDFGYVSRGICHLDPVGSLRTVVETTHIEKRDGGVAWQDDDGGWHPLTGGEPVSLNLWGLDASLFDYMEEQFIAFLEERGQEMKSEFYIPSVVDTCIQQRQAEVTMLTTDEKWSGVTYPDDKPLVQQRIRELIAAGVYPEDLWGSA